MIWKRVGRKMRGEVQVDLLPWQMHEAYLQELEEGQPLRPAAVGLLNEHLPSLQSQKSCPDSRQPAPQTSLSSPSFCYIWSIET